MRLVFCGACNPVFNLKDLVSKVKHEFPDNLDEVLVLLNGCRTGCLKAKDFYIDKIVYVAGMSVDGVEIVEINGAEEAGLSEAAIKAIRRFIPR